MRYARLLFVLLLSGCFGCNTSPGDNEKVGMIVSAHDVGLIWKTHEASLVRGGFQGGSGANGVTTTFTIESDSLARLAREYMEKGTEVRVRYRTEGTYSWARSESGGDFAYSIEPTGSQR